VKFDRSTIFFTLIAALCIAAFAVIFESREVYSVSMQPTLNPGDYIMVNRFAYSAFKPERGDVVVMKPQRAYTTELVKRIIALPGDTVQVRDHAVYVNGTALEEPYVPEPVQYEYPPEKVPGEYYFVLGDNRNYSDDSHTGWLLSGSDIIGRAYFTYWPPENMKVLRRFQR
jgi:signal peptidase I